MAEQPTRRLRACVERWAACETGSYDPLCCRFPKSCSATIYDPATVADADLEAEPAPDQQHAAELIDREVQRRVAVEHLVSEAARWGWEIGHAGQPYLEPTIVWNDDGTMNRIEVP